MSWQLRATEIGLRTFRRLRPSGTPELMQTRIAKARTKPTRFAPPAKLARSLDVISTGEHGVTVYDLQPKGSEPARHVCYLHGGSYTFEITPVHWRYLA
ncbi:MAG: alpha/beta hydrolase fold domain-containing protein, partial [Mycobacteriales bacterium]